MVKKRRAGKIRSLNIIDRDQNQKDGDDDGGESDAGDWQDWHKTYGHPKTTDNGSNIDIQG